MNVTHNDSAQGIAKSGYSDQLKLAEDEAERFWAKIDKETAASAGASDCWLWTAGCEQDGYGVFWLRRKQYRCNRVMYEIARGKIPEGHQVCHKCDTPHCVNPEHLFLGLQRDNSADMVKKGRSFKPKGMLHPMRKLDVGAVERIRAMYSTGAYNQQQIANVFSVSQTNIGLIVRREHWV